MINNWLLIIIIDLMREWLNGGMNYLINWLYNYWMIKHHVCPNIVWRWRCNSGLTNLVISCICKTKWIQFSRKPIGRKCLRNLSIDTMRAMIQSGAQNRRPFLTYTCTSNSIYRLFTRFSRAMDDNHRKSIWRASWSFFLFVEERERDRWNEQ